MTRWYKVSGWRDDIEPVEVVKETAKKIAIKSLWFGEEQVSYRDKVSKSERFFPAWLDARQYVIQRAYGKLNMAEAAVSHALQRQVKAGMIPVEEPA